MISSPIEREGLIEVTMPAAPGEGAAEVIAWRKRPGQDVAEEEPICLVSLGGVQAEVASPAAGVVARLLAEPGRVVSSGETLAEIAPPAPSPKSAPPPEAEPTREEAPTPVARATPVEMARFRSPAVRRLVALHGLDLEGVEGSGRGGRVTREDVLALLQADAAEPLSGERD